MLATNKLYLGDCLQLIKLVDSESVDMILCDLPYGTTACAWDIVIPFQELWDQYKRIIKTTGAIVLTASQPFTSMLVVSNPKWFRYEWIWVKNTQSGMMTAGKMPMKKHENILVFSPGKTKFNEQKVLGSFISQNHAKKKYGYKNKPSSLYNVDGGKEYTWSEFIHANSILLCDVVGNRDKTKIHPTQKPVALFEYLIKTYTDEGDVVLDNCSGSGTTGIACQNTKRNFILMEQDANYYDLSLKRLETNERCILTSNSK